MRSWSTAYPWGHLIVDCRVEIEPLFYLRDAESKDVLLFHGCWVVSTPNKRMELVTCWVVFGCFCWCFPMKHHKNRKPAFFPYFLHHDSTRVSPWNGRNAPLWRMFFSTAQPVETRRRVNGENNTNQVWMRRYSKVSEEGTAQKSRAMKKGPLVV